MFELSKNEVVWRADSWLFINAAGGDVSIRMHEKDIWAFASFLRAISLHPDGQSFTYGELQFDSENIEDYQGETTVVVLVGGERFVYTFAIEVDRLESLASYLEEKAEDE